MKHQYKAYISFLLLLVLGCSKDGETGEGSPGNVALLFPIKDGLCEEGTQRNGNKGRVHFKWDRAQNTDSYDLVVSDPLDGKEVIRYNTIVGLDKELELENDRSYSWKVISRNATTGETGTSESWNFFLVGEPTSNYAPFPARILSPEYGSTVALGESVVTLNWEGSDPDGDNLLYTVFLDTIDGKQEPRAELKGLVGSSLEIAVLEGTRYYWRVISSDGRNSSSTQVYYFETE